MVVVVVVVVMMMRRRRSLGRGGGGGGGPQPPTCDRQILSPALALGHSAVGGVRCFFVGRC
eukprot:8813214-Pyramimonas_sp.AAC.1